MSDFEGTLDRVTDEIIAAENAEHVAARLEALRTEIRAERISWGEIAELQGLVEHIDPDDHELLAWAAPTRHEL